MGNGNKEFKIPDNPTWEQMVGLVSDLIAEAKSYRDGWATEVIQQAKRNTRHWVIAFAITLAALIGTNTAWIYVFQSYDYISQDGNGINNYNTGTQGDLKNEPEDKEKEEWENPGDEEKERIGEYVY